MKKSLAVSLLLFFSFFLLCACVWDKGGAENAQDIREIRQEMLTNYSDDSLYYQAKGKILDFAHYIYDNYDYYSFHIELIEDAVGAPGSPYGLWKKGDAINVSENYRIRHEQHTDLKPGDIVEFTANIHFYPYSGTSPLVALKKDDHVYFTYEQGKEELLYWLYYAYPIGEFSANLTAEYSK